MGPVPEPPDKWRQCVLSSAVTVFAPLHTLVTSSGKGLKPLHAAAGIATSFVTVWKKTFRAPSPQDARQSGQTSVEARRFRDHPLTRRASAGRRGTAPRTPPRRLARPERPAPTP